MVLPVWRRAGNVRTTPYARGDPVVRAVYRRDVGHGVRPHVVRCHGGAPGRVSRAPRREV